MLGPSHRGGGGQQGKRLILTAMRWGGGEGGAGRAVGMRLTGADAMTNSKTDYDSKKGLLTQHGGS